MNDKVLAQDFNCKAHFKRGLKKGFTLAEVLITLAIIGVVAAMTIPAVIVNTNQAEFKTGLRKAVSVLNSAITLNKALTGESPYDNLDLYNYLQQHMSVMKNKIAIGVGDANDVNFIFYTTDGMRFDLPENVNDKFRLYESNSYAKGSVTTFENKLARKRGNGCGSLGLSHNPDRTDTPPCVIVVDVNGERKPNTFSGVSSPDYTKYSSGGFLESRDEGWSYYYNTPGLDKRKYSYAKPNDRLLKDMFSILITDQGAIPYGVVAQKAMYQAQK